VTVVMVGCSFLSDCGWLFLAEPVVTERFATRAHSVLCQHRGLPWRARYLPCARQLIGVTHSRLAAEPGFAGLLTGDHEASIRTPAACRAHVVAEAFLPHGIQLWFADRSPQYAAGAVEPRSAAVRACTLDVVM